jgi:PilZ domain
VPAFGKRKPAGVGGEKRRASRSIANAPAIIETTATRLPVTISDISATGARLVSFGSPPHRQDVRLYVNGLWLFGRIAWRRERAFGVKFEQGIDVYSPAEIHKAVEEASANNGGFDREAILSELMNKESSGDESSQKETSSQSPISAEAGLSTS